MQSASRRWFGGNRRAAAAVAARDANVTTPIETLLRGTPGGAWQAVPDRQWTQAAGNQRGTKAARSTPPPTDAVLSVPARPRPPLRKARGRPLSAAPDHLTVILTWQAPPHRRGAAGPESPHRKKIFGRCATDPVMPGTLAGRAAGWRRKGLGGWREGAGVESGASSSNQTQSVVGIATRVLVKGN